MPTFLYVIFHHKFLIKHSIAITILSIIIILIRLFNVRLIFNGRNSFILIRLLSQINITLDLRQV